MTAKLWLLILTLLALFLGSSRNVEAITGAALDDRHFVDQAFSLLHGQWLGAYSHTTLIKGPFYPLFLAINNVLGLPLLFSEQLFHCLSGLAFIYALSYFYRQRWGLVCLYALYIFHPVIFVTNRVVRDGVYISLTGLVFASTILMLAHLMGQVKQKRLAIYHALFWGLSFASFWLTREEGVWLVPSIVLLLGLGLITCYRHSYAQSRSVKLKTIMLQSRIPLLSLLVAIVSVVGVAIINNAHYGVFLARSEFTAPEFKAAYGALTRVQSDTWDAHIPVTHAAREQIYAQSELFRKLRPFLEDKAKVAAWNQAGCTFYPSTCGDYAGGWFMWALRDAVAQAGFTDTATHAREFYRNLAKEVNGLCKTKQLNCTSEHSGMIPPLRWVQIQQIPNAIQSGLRLLVSLDQLDILSSNTASQATPEGRDLFLDLTRTPSTPNSLPHSGQHHIKVSGWFNRLNGDVRLARNHSSGGLVKTILPSPDLVSVFHNPKLNANRFQLEVWCDDCTLAFTDEAGHELVQVDPLQGATQGSGPYGAYALDSVTPMPPEPRTIGSVKLSVLHVLNVIVYKHGLFYANIVAFGLWCWRFCSWRVIPWTIGFGIASSLLLAMVVRLLLLAVIDVTSFPVFIGPGYSSAALPLMPLFTVLVLADSAWFLRKLKPKLRWGDRHDLTQ